MPIKTGRILAGAAAALMLISTAAFAEQAEGLIRKVDKEAMTLTLDNGKSYKLNAENVITDMQVTE
jgi:hypothetical protein